MKLIPGAGGMDQDTFERISGEVNTILAVKGITRQRFQISALYEEGSGELLAEVLRTTAGPVLVYRPGIGTLTSGATFALREFRDARAIAQVNGRASIFNVASTSRIYQITSDEIANGTTAEDGVAFR